MNSSILRDAFIVEMHKALTDHSGLLAAISVGLQYPRSKKERRGDVCLFRIKDQQPLCLLEAEHFPQAMGRGGYPSLLHPVETHLHCFAQCWAAQYQGDVDILGRVQRKVTNIIRNRRIWHEERLQELGVFRLEKGRPEGLLMREVKQTEPGSSHLLHSMFTLLALKYFPCDFHSKAAC